MHYSADRKDGTTWSWSKQKGLPEPGEGDQAVAIVCAEPEPEIDTMEDFRICGQPRSWQRPTGVPSKNEDAGTRATRTRNRTRPFPRFRSLQPKADEDETDSEEDDEEDARRSRSPKTTESRMDGEISVWIGWCHE